LETREVIFAEGVAAEALPVIDGRENFANFVEYERLSGNTLRPPDEAFRFLPWIRRNAPNSKDCFDEPCLGLSMFATRSTGLVTASLREPHALSYKLAGLAPSSAEKRSG